MEKVKIAVLGLGNVGKGVWEIFQENTIEIQNRSGYEVEIAKILVRDTKKSRGLDIPSEILTSNIEDIFSDDSIKIVVELMGGVNPAKDYISVSGLSRQVNRDI